MGDKKSIHPISAGETGKKSPYFNFLSLTLAVFTPSNPVGTGARAGFGKSYFTYIMTVFYNLS